LPSLTARARKDLEALPEPLQSHARTLCGRLDAEPALGKKLQGRLQGVRSARLGRSYRILYRVGPSGITVLAIRPRRDAYR
jgi:mRNA-degrading endonuclease RelE of RelBE toxin-antitoxin system